MTFSAGGLARRKQDVVAAMPALVYSLLALMIFVLPLGGTWGSAQLGSSIYAPDNLLNAGILEWGWASLWSPGRHLFDWVAGYPVANSLAGTENLVGWQWMYTPLRALGVGPIAAFNTLVVASIIISGLSTQALARQLGVGRAGAFVAGLAFAFAPVHVALMMQFQSLSICWLPLGLLFVERVLQRRSARDAFWLIVVFCLTALSSIYFGIFLAILAVAWAAGTFVTRRYLPTRATVATLAATAASSAVLLLPVIAAYFRFARDLGFDRSRSAQVAHSVAIVDLFAAPEWVALWHNTMIASRPGFGAAFPGFAVIVLMVVALSRFAETTRLSMVTRRLLFATAALCVALSLGPQLKVFNYPTALFGGIPAPGLLLTLIPGLRFLLRVLPCAMIFVAILAGAGAEAVSSRLRRRPARVAAMACVIGAILVESWPMPTFVRSSQRVPPPQDISDAYPYVATLPGNDGAIVELPGSVGADFNRVRARYVYGSAWHRHPTVSYYASRQLPIIEGLQQTAESLPLEGARNRLVDAGVYRVVVHRTDMPDYSKRLASLDGAGYPREFTGREAVVYSLRR